MTLNPNAPYFILAAAKRIYTELPSLAGADVWKTIQSQVDTYLNTLETQPNAYLESTQLYGLLAQYEPVRQRIATEIKVQEVIGTNTDSQMRQLAAQLGCD